MTHPENSSSMVLSCPSCGALLMRDTEITLRCTSDHMFTLETLLLGQSAQAGTLFMSGLVLLEQQVKLVRAIALEQSITKPDLFLQLEMQADQLDKIINGVRSAILDAEWGKP